MVPRVSVRSWLRKSDEAAAGNAELDAHAPVAVVVHVGDFAFARAELLHDNADEIFGNVDQ